MSRRIAILLAGIGLALTSVAGTAMAATDRDLLNAANIQVDGGFPVDQAGTTVAGAGDVNGDGTDDVIVGAPSSDPFGRNGAGTAYVLFGQKHNRRLDLSLLNASEGFWIAGASAFDGAGAAVAGAGDVNGDGTDDVIVGAKGAENNGRIESGSAYVIYGQSLSADVDLALLTQSRGFRVDGRTSEEAGKSVAGAGDVNGDGRDDVIVGAPSISGSSYVLFGKATNPNLDLNSLSASDGFGIFSEFTTDGAGDSVAGAGDVNGDGLDDVIVGAPRADRNARPNSGSAFVVFGSGAAGGVSLGSLPAARGFRINGAAPDDQAGSAVAGAGDVNGDGLDDLMVGAPGADNNSRVSSGSSYVVFGRADNPELDLAGLSSSRGARIDGAGATDASGQWVAGAGDINGDGRDDVAVGAPQADFKSRVDSGAAYVVYGAGSLSNLDLAALAATSGFRAGGGATGDGAGRTVSGAGDLNGDGRDELVVGAPFAGNNSRASSGSAYVLFSTFLPRIAYREVVVASQGQPFTARPTRLEASGTAVVQVAPGLPAGLVLDPATGVISGTPTQPGITSHRVSLTDALGATATTMALAVVNAAGPAGPQGPVGQPGAKGPRGAAGRNAKVKCRVTARGRKSRVTCRVKLVKTSKRSLGWRLVRGGKTWRRGRLPAGSRVSAIRIPRIRALRSGRYLLKIKGRRSAVAIRIG